MRHQATGSEPPAGPPTAWPVRRRRWAAAATLAVVGVALWTAPVAAAGTHPRRPDRAILAAGVLTGRDVPRGWPAQPVSSGPQFSGFRGIPACGPIVAVDAAATRGSHAVSRSYRDPSVPGGAAAATDEVYAFPTAAAAVRYLAAFQAPGAAACLQSGLAEQTGGQVGVAAAPSHLSGIGDDNAGFNAVISTTDAQGKPYSAVLDFSLVRVGRAVVDLAFTNPGAAPLPHEQQVVSAVVARLAAARQ